MFMEPDKKKKLIKFQESDGSITESPIVEEEDNEEEE